ncbi:hypothetical protein DFJ77DRAFT_538736 [Powellomyces hirtus]|nr:hypothetical protein DFJ77DRAFT_538736 [Powellomyces hirtus]
MQLTIIIALSALATTVSAQSPGPAECLRLFQKATREGAAVSRQMARIIDARGPINTQNQANAAILEIAESNCRVVNNNIAITSCTAEDIEGNQPEFQQQIKQMSVFCLARDYAGAATFAKIPVGSPGGRVFYYVNDASEGTRNTTPSTRTRKPIATKQKPSATQAANDLQVATTSAPTITPAPADAAAITQPSSSAKTVVGAVLGLSLSGLAALALL